jgi:iron complex outermembrane recepter protein
LSLIVNNVLSEKYETNAWYYSYYYNGVRNEMNGYFTQAPVNFMGGLTLKF